MMSQRPLFAKFEHETGTSLRLQAFLLVRDEKRRVACLRLSTSPAEWALPGEMLLLNEDPADAARRVVKTWFETPLEPKLSSVFSFPATGPDDPKWYVLLVYEAQAPANLRGTMDTLEIRFVTPGEAPGPFGFDHASVFEKIAP